MFVHAFPDCDPLHAPAGLQAQTAECLVVGEMAAQHLVVALNKTDLLPAEERPKLIKKVCVRSYQGLLHELHQWCLLDTSHCCLLYRRI